MAIIKINLFSPEKRDDKAGRQALLRRGYDASGQIVIPSLLPAVLFHKASAGKGKEAEKLQLCLPSA